MSIPSHPALEPVSFAGLALRNRLAVAPMTRVSTAGDGVPTEAMKRYYARFARGGFGLIITEGTYTDLAYSQGYGRQPGIASDAQAAAWSGIAGAVQSEGGKIVLQLMHAGALVQGNRYRDRGLAPSAVQPKGKKMPEYGGEGPYPMPRAMQDEDFHQVIEGFASAARRARAAGFDGVEIHGANGYLLDQFLTTYTNLRSDGYGGEIAHRIRFAAEVVRGVRDAVGADFVVGLRLSEAKVNDKAYVWPGGGADAHVIFDAVRAAGASYVHLAGEGRELHMPEGGAKTGLEAPTYGQIAKRAHGLPVIANGGLDDPARAARVLEQGHGDLVALGRAAIANPDWPRRLARGAGFLAFDPEVLHPTADLENETAWRQAHGGDGDNFFA